MPKRNDINSVLVIGAGPIVIGQACEFDYSGTQACRALRREGVRIVLLNSNPATIMTDPSMADATYIEPVNADTAARIIEKEQVDAVLPTMGGQTALNCAIALNEMGVFGKGRQADGKPVLIGAGIGSIRMAEDREQFKQAMEDIGQKCSPSALVSSVEEARAALPDIGFPVILRPSFTLGGSGGGIAYNQDEFDKLVTRGLAESPTHSVLLERSLIGWKEYEMEVVRDSRDNCIIICSIENVDAMGVHTGDSITVAPAQTLTDKEYQQLRDASIAILRKIGVDTGGANVQFAINPQDGEMLVIEMNPRVSRSSALASKATGFPIAKVATLLAMGYTLDEVANDITGGKTPASFEPSIDYIVTKVPRFDFAKFPGTEDALTTQMRSVGEVMAVGATFAESLQKALRGLEVGKSGLSGAMGDVLGGLFIGKRSMVGTNHWKEDGCIRNWTLTHLKLPLGENGEEIKKHKEYFSKKLSKPHSLRIFDIGDAFRIGIGIDDIHESTHIDKWFLNEIKEIIDVECDMAAQMEQVATVDEEGTIENESALLRQWKKMGFSDAQISTIAFRTDYRRLGRDELVYERRKEYGIHPIYRRIDTCAGEFPTETAYMYSTYHGEAEHCELRPTDKKKIIILGSGPNRIGQGIEFDYCCVHGVMALRDAGFETIMVNCNPETVSTDYDTANRLFFEPLTVEDVSAIIRREKPYGVIVQFGGQTPLSIARGLETVCEQADAKIIGTPVEAIDCAESRERFQQLLKECGLKQPNNAIVGRVPMLADNDARHQALLEARHQALQTANTLGYPLVVRPSYVLGGRAMKVVHDSEEMDAYLDANINRLHGDLLLDKFLNNAIEVDVDAVRDTVGACLVAGVMEHIERAGVHSGDSACSLPPYSLPAKVVKELKRQTKRLAKKLGVIGIINVQFAVVGEEVYVLEVNPRASRTVPFVSKVTGVAVAKVAALAMAGITLEQQGVSTDTPQPSFYAVKEAVFPFNKFPKVDVLLGPEMKSTGESMGAGGDFAAAYFLAQEAIQPLPKSGAVFFSIRDKDKAEALPYAQAFTALGFKVLATHGTAAYLKENAGGIKVEVVNKVKEGRPHIVDRIVNGEVQVVVNTENNSAASREDSFMIRRTALNKKIICFTTLAGTAALLQALRLAKEKGRPEVRALQQLTDCH